MKKKTDNVGIVWKILLPLCTALWLWFIFGNSLQAGEQSGAQSAPVVDIFQKVVGVFAPKSWLATAEGADYDRLHLFIRKAAHFGEFALLGVLLCSTYFAYTSGFRDIYIPVSVALYIPFVDEYLQMLVPSRVASFADIIVDIAGGLTGILLVALIALIIKNKKRKKNGNG